MLYAVSISLGQIKQVTSNDIWLNIPIISVKYCLPVQARSQRGDMGACPPVAVGQFFHGPVWCSVGFPYSNKSNSNLVKLSTRDGSVSGDLSTKTNGRPQCMLALWQLVTVQYIQTYQCCFTYLQLYLWRRSLQKGLSVYWRLTCDPQWLMRDWMASHYWQFTETFNLSLTM